MIRVTMELLPADPSKPKKLLGVMDIANDETSVDLTRGTYSCRVSKFGQADTSQRPWRKGLLENFPRSKLGPWDLLLMLLTVMLAPRIVGSGAAFRPLDKIEEGME